MIIGILTVTIPVADMSAFCGNSFFSSCMELLKTVKSGGFKEFFKVAQNPIKAPKIASIHYRGLLPPPPWN